MTCSSATQNAFLCFHFKNGNVKAPKCYLTRTLRIPWSLIALLLQFWTELCFPGRNTKPRLFFKRCSSASEETKASYSPVSSAVWPMWSATGSCNKRVQATYHNMPTHSCSIDQQCDWSISSHIFPSISQRLEPQSWVSNSTNISMYSYHYIHIQNVCWETSNAFRSKISQIIKTAFTFGMNRYTRWR